MTRDLIWLTDEMRGRLRPFFSKSRGTPRMDDRRVLGGIMFVNRMDCAGAMRQPPTARSSGTNAKLHAIADVNGRPFSFFRTAGQVSDYNQRGSVAR